jgi:hypothetical protein
LTMGEIKSAIELAMERTKNLVMSEDEKRQFARKDTEERLRAVIRRFQEGMIVDDGFLREVGEIQGDEQYKKGLAVDIVIQEFETATENERLFAILELLGKDRGGKLAEDAREMKVRFHKELDSRQGEIRKKVLARLAGLGISGSAIRPNISEWEESRDAAREIGGLIRSRVSEWKKKFLAPPA